MNKFVFLLFCVISSLHATSPVESITIELSSSSRHDLAIDKDLEANPQTRGKKVLDEYLKKNGTYHVIKPFDSSYNNEKVVLQPGDAVYPACSGGFCRSQTLWALLRPFEDKIILFPAHATRYGFDPYNGKVNWHRNDGKEDWPDGFRVCFDFDKSTRFGFPEFMHYKPLDDHNVTPEILQEITEFYNTHYYGPTSSWQGKKGLRRVYVAFAANAHAVLHRLNQANDDLSHVVVYYIESEDYISHPLPEWNMERRSAEVYCKYGEILEKLLDTSALQGR